MKVTFILWCCRFVGMGFRRLEEGRHETEKKNPKPKVANKRMSPMPRTAGFEPWIF